MFEVPEVVQARARLIGAGDWLEALPVLVTDLSREWSLALGEVLSGGSEALVIAAEDRAGKPLVLKLLLPEVPGAPAAARYEITALRLADGRGCARLEQADLDRRAMLLERLGPPLSALDLPTEEREDILVRTAADLWRPVPDADLPTGAEKAQWLIEEIERLWSRLSKPCSRAAVDHALACASRRLAAHRDERAVLVHGDVHDGNTLQAEDGFKLVDPDGLLAEPEYDVGVILRERTPGPAAASGEDVVTARARMLADHHHLDPVAIVEWATVERLSTGLTCLDLGLDEAAERLLAAAEEAARIEL